MDAVELQHRRKVVKNISIGLLSTGFIVPFAITYIKYKDFKTGLLMGVGGIILAGILSAGIAVAAIPSPEK